MPEQQDHRQKDSESDQQTPLRNPKGDMMYENHRCNCSGRIQRRN